MLGVERRGCRGERSSFQARRGARPMSGGLAVKTARQGFLFIATGSFGDAAPLLSLATELSLAHGCWCDLLVSQCLQEQLRKLLPRSPRKDDVRLVPLPLGVLHCKRLPTDALPTGRHPAKRLRSDQGSDAAPEEEEVGVTSQVGAFECLDMCLAACRRCLAERVAVALNCDSLPTTATAAAAPGAEVAAAEPAVSAPAAAVVYNLASGFALHVADALRLPAACVTPAMPPPGARMANRALWEALVRRAAGCSVNDADAANTECLLPELVRLLRGRKAQLSEPQEQVSEAAHSQMTALEGACKCAAMDLCSRRSL